MTHKLVYTCDGCDEDLEIDGEHIKNLHELDKFKSPSGWKFEMNIPTIGSFDLCKGCYARWTEAANPRRWSRAIAAKGVAPSKEFEIGGKILYEVDELGRRI